jgi:hypothetical protein
MQQFLLIFRVSESRRTDCVVVVADDEAEARALGREVETHLDAELWKVRQLAQGPRSR